MNPLINVTTVPDELHVEKQADGTFRLWGQFTVWATVPPSWQLLAGRLARLQDGTLVLITRTKTQGLVDDQGAEAAARVEYAAKKATIRIETETADG